MSYKVLVVDDFLPDRAKMIENLEKCKFDLTISDSCENGLEALQSIEKNIPDIIISDIEMPLCNGLELAKRVKDNYPQIKMIFSSLYSEFKYVKLAMQYSGYGYILKPVAMEELEYSIGNAIDDLEEESLNSKNQIEYEKILQNIQKNKRFYGQELVRNLITGFSDMSSREFFEEALLYELPLIEDCFALCYVEIDEHSDFVQNYRGSKRQVYIYKALEKLENIVKGNNAVAVHITAGVFGILVSAYDYEIAVKRDEIAKKIVDAFKEGSLPVSVAVSEPTDTLLNISTLYIQCQYQIKFKFVFGESSLIHPKDISEEKHIIDFNLNAIVNEFRFYINSGQVNKMAYYVDSLFAKYENTNDYWRAKDLSILVSIAIIYFMSENNLNISELIDEEKTNFYDLIFNFKNIDTTKTWVKESLSKLITLVHSRNLSTNNHLLQKIKKYVKENVKKNFTMEDMAKNLFYSPNYLNRVFKQEMGMTILDYATQERMNIARDMLLDSKYKFYEIADELGYSNPAYFNMLFKKKYGMTLKDYRKKYCDFGAETS